ncbi:MAG: hypothetical protein JNG83_13055 [Opitutaceae bacterium]|nr:hypothetical protein [Opitutaceae bacterium]
MKWIVVAIVLFVAGYTLVNLYFRKPGRAYRPYQDAQDRATTARLLAAGWQKVPVDTRVPAEKPADASPPAAVTRASPGLGADFAPNFAEPPRLLASIDRVVAPAAVSRDAGYSAYFTASLADLKAQLGELTLYRRDHEFVLVPAIEPLPGRELKSRWNDSTYWLHFATSGLPPGRYQMRIVANGPAAVWTFEVR